MREVLEEEVRRYREERRVRRGTEGRGVRRVRRAWGRMEGE
jgi:hypothetical protein